VKNTEKFMDLRGRRYGACVAPAARGALAGDETQRQTLNHLFIFFFAEPVQEKDAQGNVIGVVHRQQGLPDERLGLQQHRIVFWERRHSIRASAGRAVYPTA